MRKIPLIAVVAAAALELALLSSPSMAQVATGCQEVAGKGSLCKQRFTFQNGLTLPQSTVAALPACNAALKGTLRAVSDATAPTYNGALTGGGAVSVPVYCSGAAWLSH